MPKLKFKLPEIETQNLSLICGPVNANLEQIENSLAIKIFVFIVKFRIKKKSNFTNIFIKKSRHITLLI